MSSLNVGTLQSSDDGNTEVHGLNDGNQTLGDGIASHDTTKDVDEDGGDLGVAGDEVKGLLDGLGAGSTTDVEEVGGRSAVELDDIHGGHGEAGAVDQASNITVELDEVETRLGGLDLVGILLAGVTPVENLLLSEVCVVVKVELGVHAEDLVVRGLGKRVDLDLSGILLHKDLVKLLDRVGGIINALLRETNVGGNLASDLVRDALVDVNDSGEDCFRVLLCDSLDIHTTLRRRDDDWGL